MTTQHDRMKASVRGQIDALERRLGRLETFGADEYEDDAVVMYKREGFIFGGRGKRLLTYVAIKAGGKWWISNGENRAYSWDELIALMCDSPEVWLATEWGQVL